MLRAKRMAMAAAAILAMAACGDANGPGEEAAADGIGPNVSQPIDLPDTFNGGGGPTQGAIPPGEGMSPHCDTGALQAIILPGPTPCSRR